MTQCPSQFRLRNFWTLKRLFDLNYLNFVFKRFDTTDDASCPSLLHGIDYIRNPKLNKGLAFTLWERQALGIHGLMAPAIVNQDLQLAITHYAVRQVKDDLNKFVFLTELHDRNERLYYRLLTENIEEFMPIVYTPTVGLACQKFGLLYRRPRGLFITINDKGHVYQVLRNWPEPIVKAICVTDGERILGLGDLGAFGMGIPVGKLALYTALGGVKPWYCLPVTIDVGTNNEQFLQDPLYIGLRQKRAQQKEYDELLDEFMEACVKRFGPNVLIQFEDFAAGNAFRLLNKYRNDFCTFNDDIQGTAAVVLAGLLASIKLTHLKFSDNVIVFLGAGGAATGIAELCVKYMSTEGVNEEEARSKIWMVDIEGLLTTERQVGHLAALYAKKHAPLKTLLEVVKSIKPTILIGVSAAAKAFTPEVLGEMAKNNEKPIIFALSNPTSKSECSAEDAYTYTEGKCIFASGSPSNPFKYNGKLFKPGQGNNAYVFPGIGLGVVISRLPHINDIIFIIAAKTLANMSSNEDLEFGRVYPALDRIPEISLRIAVAITEYAYKNGMAVTYPEPENKYEYIKQHLYNYSYDDPLPKHYEWPTQEHHVAEKSLIESGFTIKSKKAVN